MLSVNHDIEDAKNGALDAIEEAKNDVDSFIASSKSEIDSLLSSSLDDIKNLTDTSKLNISTLTDEKLASLDKETIRQLKNIELAGVEETEKIRTAFSSAVSDIQTEGQKQADAIDSHGDSKIKEINDSTATSLANINSISEKQVEAIQLEGTKQTSSVSSEGNKQVSTVASAGATEVTKVKKASSTALSDIGSAKESSISEITAKGTEQVKTIKDTSASEISKVQEAGISQVKSVSDEGKIQIDGVKSEGEKQVQSVSAKGTQSLQDIDTAKTAAVKSVNDQTKPIIDKVEQLKQNVNDKSDSVDETYEQMKKLHCIEISEEAPTNERAGLWVNPKSNEEINIPEIKDEEVSGIDTWSSQKINHEIDSLNEDKITKPAEAPTIGKIIRVKSVNEDGTFICEWADSASDLDVQIDGKSIVQNGVAEIPLANRDNVLGVIKTIPYEFWGTGVGTNTTGQLQLYPASEKNIDARQKINVSPISVKNLDYAVKAAMCDGKGAAWTADEQAAARERMGLNATLISKIVIEEEVSVIKLFNDQEHPLREYFIYMVSPIATAASAYIQRVLVNADKNNKIFGKTIIMYNIAATDTATTAYARGCLENNHEIVNFIVTKYNTGNAQLSVNSEGQYKENLEKAIGFSELNIAATNDTKIPIGTTIELYGMRW